MRPSTNTSIAFARLSLRCTAIASAYRLSLRSASCPIAACTSVACPAARWRSMASFFETLCIGGDRNLKNFRKYPSVLSLACADIDYRFRWASRLWEGGAGDARVWNASELKNLLDTEQWPIGPLGEPISIRVDRGHGRSLDVPVWISADSAFAQSPNVVKPFPGAHLSEYEQLFNNRHSSVRQMIEQAWGYLTGYFEIPN